MKKKGVLLLNLGGPWSLEEVKPFLYNLFKDPDILVGVPAPIRQLIAFTIAQVKGPSSIEAYRSIGGKSPQLHWTTQQARALNELLDSTRQAMRVAIGMRASSPTIEEGLEDLRRWGAEEVILFPLFPQYSTTTTGSCFKEAKRVMKSWNWAPPLREVRNWPDHPGYIELLKLTLAEVVAQAEGDLARDGASDEKIHILFSAHSLPMKIIERGDPYPEDVQRTLLAAAQGLTHPWSLAFQSRNGKMPWLTPYTENEIERLGEEGIKRLVVIPISFVSDHIETLFELDQLYADLARKSGIQKYYRARSFNDDQRFAKVLHSVVAAHAG